MKFILNGRLTEYNILISFFDSNFIDICSTIHHDACSFSRLRLLVASEICNALILPRIIGFLIESESVSKNRSVMDTQFMEFSRP